jgi:hypothetical protein
MSASATSSMRSIGERHHAEERFWGEKGLRAIHPFEVRPNS